MKNGYLSALLALGLTLCLLAAGLTGVRAALSVQDTPLDDTATRTSHNQSNLVGWQPFTTTEELYLPLVMRGWPPPSWHSQCVDCPSFIYDTTPRSIAVDSAGRPHVAYGGDHIYHAWNDGTRSLRSVQGGWQVEVADASPNVGAWASLALDGNDYPHVSYYDSENKDLKYAHWDGSAWITETVDTLGGWDTAIALDSSGRPHIAYRYATSGPDLKYAAWDGSDWQITTIESDISAASNRDTSIALDGGDNPHIGYVTSHHGSDPSELKHAWWGGSQWQVETVETVGHIGSNSLALSAAGDPRFAYSAIEGSAYQVKYAVGTGRSGKSAR